MNFKPELSDGQNVTFHIRNVDIAEFELDDDEIDISKRDGKPCVVVCLATTNAGVNDEPNKEFEYYDIRFGDGLVLSAISGHHLEIN